MFLLLVFYKKIKILLKKKQWKKGYKTLDYWFRDMLNFNYLEKDLGIVYPAHLVYDYSKKNFLTLYSIKWPSFLVRLPLLLEIFVSMCIVVVCPFGCGVLNFEINLNFIIKPLLYMPYKSIQKFKYCENKKSF